jgi:enoyl-CoA hydratase/carnithine racemase
VPDKPVLFEIDNRIAQITLNRPDNRNSMTPDMMAAFQEAVEEVKRLADLRCLIITGSGKSFCAGADFKSDRKDSRHRLPNEVLMDAYRPFLSLVRVEIPIIASMNGHAIGGGFGLALVCDIRIASKDSKYGANFARLGLHSGMGISYMLPRLVGLPMANELLFTGRLFTGDKAAEMGLVNYAVASEEVLTKARDLATEIAACAPVAVKMIKRSIYRGLDWNLEKAAEMEAHCQSRTFEMEDAGEGIRALLEKREPDFKGR